MADKSGTTPKSGQSFKALSGGASLEEGLSLKVNFQVENPVTTKNDRPVSDPIVLSGK